MSFPVLIVEDHARTGAVMAMLLKAVGLNQVEHASDGDQALTRLERGDVRLVLSDYHMAPMNGLDLLASMRAEETTADIPFIMVSADKDFRLVREAARAHIELLIKPFKADQLRQSLLRAVGRQSFEEAVAAPSPT